MNLIRISKKITIIFFIIILSFIIIFIKMIHLQFIDNNKIIDNANNLWTREVPIQSSRGNIYDRNGELLVGNKLTASLAIIPRQVTNKDEVVSYLTNVLDADRESIEKHFNKNVSIELIKPEGRKISLETAEKIIKQNFDGVYVVSDSTRYYPYGNYLSQVLGFTGIDNQGIAGIEYIYDDFLSGKSGNLGIYTDAKGYLMKDMYSLYNTDIKGYDVYLTIDIKVQLIIERIIKEAVERYNPDQMMVLVTNIKTGEILGMSSYPSFDPENYQDYPQEIYNRNLPIWMNYEPGSTFKIITYSAGLEEGVFMLDEGFYDPGYKIVAGHRIKDWKAGGHGQQTFLEVIQNSCNPGFMEIGERLGKERLFKYIDLYGFGKKTGVDLLGESSGIVFNVDDVGPLELATSSFGQGNSVTPIQLVMAANASVNGGNLLTPYILKDVKIPILNEVIYKKETEIKRQVISLETSKKVAYALENVVAKGTGRGAYVEGYRIGGKTGTAQKVGEDGNYLQNNYILSFLGMAPMNNPEISVYLAIDNPKNTIQYGGVVAAPLVGEIFEEILPLLGIEKQYDTQIEKDYRYYIDTKYYTVKNYIGLNKKDILTSYLYQINFVGTGSKVVSQLPNPGERIKENGVITLYLRE